MQAVYIAMLYSAYLTLSNYTYFTYAFILALNILAGLLGLISLKDSALIGQLCVMAVYCLHEVAIWKGSEDFRKFLESIYNHPGVQHMIRTGSSGMQELLNWSKNNNYNGQ